MTISLITINYNNILGLKKTLESVNNQTYNNFEHIIVDGNSNDGSKELINAYKKKSCRIVRVLVENDDGIYDAMNKGLALAKGKTFGFLNSGDIFSSNGTLEKIDKKFKLSPFDVVYGDLNYRDNSNRIIRSWKSGVFARWKLWLGWMPPHPATYIKRKSIPKDLNFTCDFSIAADYDFLLKILINKKYQVGYVRENLVTMEVGGISNASAKNILRSNIEVLKSWRKVTGVIPIWLIILKPLRKVFQLYRTI